MSNFADEHPFLIGFVIPSIVLLPIVWEAAQRRVAYENEIARAIMGENVVIRNAYLLQDPHRNGLLEKLFNWEKYFLVGKLEAEITRQISAQADYFTFFSGGLLFLEKYDQEGFPTHYAIDAFLKQEVEVLAK